VAADLSVGAPSSREQVVAVGVVPVFRPIQQVQAGQVGLRRRRQRDLPPPVRLVLRVRRLFCTNPDCVKTTFAEQIPGLAMRYARRTVALDQVLGAVALALGGRAGQRLSQHLAHWSAG
jgi:hypothetical protein